MSNVIKQVTIRDVAGGISSTADIGAKAENVVLQDGRTVEDLAQDKQNQIQFDTMPTAGEDYVGEIYQYIGATTTAYTNGYFYKCVTDGQSVPTYSWDRVDVQPGGSGSGDMLASVYDSDGNVAEAGGIEEYVEDETLPIWQAQGQLGAKNLLGYPYVDSSKTTNGVTFTPNSDGSITIDGTATAQTNFILATSGSTKSISREALLKYKNFIMSGGVSDSVFLNFWNPEGDGNSKASKTDEVEFNFVNQSANYNLVIVVRNGVVVDNLTIYPMLRLASDLDFTWVPYAPTNYQLEQEIKTSTLAKLADTTISTPKVGQVLKYNGSSWVNSTEGRYNVLDYGLKGDNSTDNSDAFEAMLALSQFSYKSAVIYFPAGRYRFSRPIVINPTNSGLLGVTLMGDTVVGKQYSDGTSTAIPESTLIYTGDANTTFIKGGDNCWTFNVHGLHFSCIDGFSFAVNETPLPEPPLPQIPYNVFVSSTTKDGIIGVGKSHSMDVSNCVFTGFSGAGLESDVHCTIHNSSFDKCKIGLNAEYDNIINDCWFNDCGTAVVAKKAGSSSSQDWSTLIMNDTWIDQCTRGIYSPAAQITMWLVGNIFDMFDEAAILCDGKIINSLIIGHVQRAGMKYAGLDDADRDAELVSQTDAIVASQILRTQIDIAAAKRSIGKGPHSTATSPSRFVTAKEGIIESSEITNHAAYYVEIIDSNMVTTLTNTTIVARDFNSATADPSTDIDFTTVLGGE